MQIGDLEVSAIYDGVGKFDADRFRGTTDEMWSQHQQFIDEDGKVELALGGFLITGIRDRLVLVDTGMGAPRRMFHDAGHLLESLAAIGVQPGDLTDVIFTHLHFDHVGWASRDGEIVFPNATFRCDVRDLEHFMGKNEEVTEIMTPVADRMETWDRAGTILPGVDAMVAPGHTPGSTIMVISSGTARGLLLGDVVHCPVELEEDEWGGLGDVDPELAQRTKTALIRELEGTDIPAAAAHFPGLEFGRLLSANGKRHWVV